MGNEMSKEGKQRGMVAFNRLDFNKQKPNFQFIFSGQVSCVLDQIQELYGNRRGEMGGTRLI